MKTSTSIKRADWVNGSLFVTFTSGPKSYEFLNVPESVYEEFMAAPSLGIFFAKRIRGTYDEAADANL